MTRTRRASRRGNSLMEFGLVGIILVPLFLGTTNLGLNLGRSVQVQQLARDAGHMYVRQVDFSLVKNRKLLVRLGQNLGLQDSAGPGVLIMSKIMLIGLEQCAAGGMAGACPNQGKPVIIERLTLGTNNLKASVYGTPSGGIVGPNGNIAMSDYLADASAVTAGFSPGLLTGMLDGETAFLVETYFEFPEWFMNTSYTNKGIYARSVY